MASANNHRMAFVIALVILQATKAERPMPFPLLDEPPVANIQPQSQMVVQRPGRDLTAVHEVIPTAALSGSCGSSATCLAACYLDGTCAGAMPAPTVSSVAGIESARGAARTTTAAPAVQVIRGDASAFFATAIGKGLTCYTIVNSKPVSYAAKPDVNGILTCTRAQQIHAGMGVATESANKLPITATGAFLQERTRDPAFGGKFNPALDNPGRIPGQYADALEALLTAPNPASNIAEARLIAGEAQIKFLDGQPVSLPRSLGRQSLLPLIGTYGPDFYSSTLGGPDLMLQLLQLAIIDPISSQQYLTQSIKFANVMMSFGTDRYGAVHSPLFSSVLLLANRPVLPPFVNLSQFAPPGGGIFRPNNFPNVFPGALGSGPDDQAYWGANVAADQALYQLLYLLTTTTGNPRFAAAADAALSFFLASCLVPESGLLAWGAHAQWDFYNDTWAQGVQSYNGTACCPQENQLHELVAFPDALWAKLWTLNATAMEMYMQGLVRGCVVNIGNPSAMAYDGRAALWASPRLTAANSSLAPSSIQPPLSVLVQRGEDGGNLLHVGALSLKLSKNLAFLAAQENVWVAFATGIMGQKTKYLTPYYPDGTFMSDGRPAPGGLKVPTSNLGRYAYKAAKLLPTTGAGSKYRAALIQIYNGATLNTLSTPRAF